MFRRAEEKILLDRARLARVLEPDRSRETIVFTNGCFDILHTGHVTYLEQARDLGTRLVVGLNSDASVRLLGKGPGRPVNELAARARVMAALECVDFVTSFDEGTPVETLRLLRPHIHCKGGDYRPDSLPEADVVRDYGGRIAILPFVQGFSTTSILARAKSPES